MQAMLRDVNGFVKWVEIPYPPKPVHKVPVIRYSSASSTPGPYLDQYVAKYFYLSRVDHEHNVAYYDER